MLFERYVERLAVTYKEAARQIVAAGGAKTIGRSSICNWSQGRNGPSRRNATAIEAWSGIPAPSWDEVGKADA